MPDKILNAVSYARYSSHLQREESITAQLRAIDKFAEDNGYILLASYVDEAQSGTNDNRMAFQKMIADIKNGSVKADAVIVHKLDRFARNRYDAAVYRNFLNKQGIKLISVTENLQDSPESVILQSVIEGMNEYYSLNLRREVRKGLRENALKATHTGGTPPLGYDVDPVTKKLIINPTEAEAVKMIFTMYYNGSGYTEIINTLNANGYKTKRGHSFVKNSINSILKNEKYTGLYTYNLVSPKYSESGKTKRYARAEDDDLIQIPDAVPVIIDKEMFDEIQKRMAARKHKAGTYNAKENYLLSGKIFCGECGAPYTGNKRKANGNHPIYISYRCSKRNGKNKFCRNTEIRKEYIEDIVLKKISSLIFDDTLIPKLYERMNAYVAEREGSTHMTKARLESQIKDISHQIDNLVSVIAKTGSQAVLSRLDELEKEKALLDNQLQQINRELRKSHISKSSLKRLFNRAKKLFECGTLEASKQLIDLFVERIDIFPDRIEIKLNILPDGVPPKARKGDKPCELFKFTYVDAIKARRDDE